ncbi:indolepyruvate ferredoxin oxidoreductase alpha subunit [Ruminococcus sp. YE71]|uniref:indolepyruvate ferredoxin oxidoreductase subunit alpha n=1 Tax=unclassified Ruminococcus TaxID=2608920 RepID=UPI00087E77F0|nr:MULTISPECIES: indolepyruvate ferredoxin oxidoreductase subunit alpha [unclassified Ruminococcus]SDA12030.1 indolepyruvate ferredoxin oxidoreductase alpha subunit [Ruminococcus sp. YE78]SFW16125.1 indolepyruvate ferredoxin oxidoreductase alpha subunit [Ruminococcus sp. YE71]
MKKLMLGNEAFARGLYEAGCEFVSSYPGTPSTEVTEFAAKYDEMYAEWAPNEKVAMEAALGASIAGKRSFCGMKHVGLNVAADPLYTAGYTGVNGGMVVCVADDPGMHSSQNEQDSRHHAIASKVLMVEPSDSQECKDFTKTAFELSEKFDCPVIVRMTTRIAHSQSSVELLDRVVPDAKPYEKNPGKFVMVPGNAKRRHPVVEQKLRDAAEYAETSPLNRVEYNDTSIGIIAAGDCYVYAKEALGDKASYLKLGMVNPLPVNIIRDFAEKCGKVYVIEELDDIIETHCKKNGVSVIGREVFSGIGEISQSIVRKAILGETAEVMTFGEDVPVRPPVMCAGCPHRGLFYCLSQLGVYVSGDIGCYTLGSAAPLCAMDTTICMGASISALHGYNKALGADAEKKSVAVIGDSTFMHSGMTGLVNVAYNASNSTTIILDNSITGMTGHQQNPTTGKNLKGDPAAAVNLEELCKAIGIRSVRVVDPYHMAETKKVIEEELAKDEPSVIISRRPCALLKYVKHNPPLHVDEDKCVGCKQCLKVGCPAISIKNKKSVIDHTQCVGCGICTELCKLNAII